LDTTYAGLPQKVIFPHEIHLAFRTALQGQPEKRRKDSSSPASPFIPFVSKPQKVFLKKYFSDSKAPSHHMIIKHVFPFVVN
jgi:hypothetical protein